MRAGGAGDLYVRPLVAIPATTFGRSWFRDIRLPAPRPELVGSRVGMQAVSLLPTGLSCSNGVSVVVGAP